MNARAGRRWFGMVVALVVAAPATARSQIIRGSDGDPIIRIEGRMQPQFYLQHNEPYASTVGPTNQFFLRRARFRFRIYLRDNLSVLLNPSYEGVPASVKIQDAYVDLRLSKSDANTYILLRTGQFKTRFGRYENASSTNLPSLERGRGLGGLAVASNDLFKSADFLGRDVGIAAFFGNTTSPAHWGFGKTPDGQTPKHGWGVSIAVFNGQGASAQDVNNRKSYGTRGTYRLTKNLDLGAAVYLHDGIVGIDSSATNVAYGLEAEWGAIGGPGLWIDFETMYGQQLATGRPWMLGVTTAAAYNIRLKEGSPFWAIEPAAQIDLGDPNTDAEEDASWLFRIGVNAYMTPKTQLRLMLENQVFNAPGMPSIYGVRTGLTVSW